MDLDNFVSCDIGSVFEDGDTINVLQTIIGCMYCGIAMAKTGKDGFVAWNKKAKEILGKEAKNIPVEQWSIYYGLYDCENGNLFKPENLPLARALKGNKVSDILFVKNENQPGLWIEVNASPINDKDGNVIGAVAVFMDFARNRILEKQLNLFKQELGLLKQSKL